MIAQYEAFFTTSAGASAALLGLMVVAVSVVNADDKSLRTRELRTVLAGSAFVILVDVFIVSMVGLVGGSGALGGVCVVMGPIGLWVSVRLVRRAHLAGNFSPTSQTRVMNMAFAGASFVTYTAQLILAVLLFTESNDRGPVKALVYLLIVFYVSALGRAWEVSGITRRE